MKFPLPTLMFGLLTLKVILGKKCPKGFYGDNCLMRCKCDLRGTDTCERATGLCTCKQGFSGYLCDKDVNECRQTEGHRLCGARFTYCKNTVGSYECDCKSGYRRRFGTSRCYPCGKACLPKCDCDQDNTAACDAEIGSCVCRPGWEGVRCEKNINDCIPHPCGTQECVDKHMDYLCLCGAWTRYVKSKCLRYFTELIIHDLNPVAGEVINMYILYKLAAPWVANPELNPNFVYELQINGEPFCMLSFHKTYRRVRGNERFINELNSGTKYNFYSHFRVRLPYKSGIYSLTARATDEEYRSMHKVLTVKVRSPLVPECLSAMTIEGTSECADLDVTCAKSGPVPVKFRQTYYAFEIKPSPTSECTEIPKYNWEYLYVNQSVYDVDETPFCWSSADTRYLDVDRLTELSGFRHVSDHQGTSEIVVKNSLPTGLILMCVTAYLLDNLAFSAVTCGAFNMTPSFVIKGNLHPLSDKLFFTSEMTLVADFYEPDNNEELTYDWQCKHKTKKWDYDLNRIAWVTVPWATCGGERREGGRVLYVSGSAWLFKSYMDTLIHHLKLTVSIKRQPHVSVTAEREIQYFAHRARLFGEFKLLCKSGCEPRIGMDGVIHLEAVETRGRRRYKSILREWRLLANGVQVPPEEVKLQIRKEWSGGSLHFQSRPNTLTPGVSYELIFHNVDINKRKRARDKNARRLKVTLNYRFYVIGRPVGNGCEVTPDKGDALFTNFTVICHNYTDIDSGLPLTYRLYQREIRPGQVEESDSLIAYGSSNVITNITLATQQVNTQIDVHLTAQISSVQGSHTSVNVVVKLNVDDQQVLVNKLMRASWLQRSTGFESQGRVRSLNNAATVIYEKSTATRRDKILLRNRLLVNVNDVRGHSSEAIEHTSIALDKSTAKEDEIQGSGLSPGLHASNRLTKYVGKVSNEDYSKVHKVAEGLSFAVSRLIAVSTTRAREALNKNLTEDPDAYIVLLENKEQSKSGVLSISNIADALGRHVKPGEPVNISTEHVDIGVSEEEVRPGSDIKLGRENLATFYLPSELTGAAIGDHVEASYHVYDKNPYVFAASNVYGDLPVMKVNFVRKAGEAKTAESKTGSRQVHTRKEIKPSFRFSQPADVFLDLHRNSSETLSFPIIVDVEKIGGRRFIVKSSCIYMSVPASTEEGTVLEIHSDDDLPIKIHMRYTNSLVLFDKVTDIEAMEIPFSEDWSIKTSRGVMYRDKNLLFIPQLSKPQKRKAVDFFRVKLHIKLELDVTDLDLNLANYQGEIEGSDSDLDTINAYNTTITVQPYRMSCKHFDESQESFLSDQCMMSMYSNTSLLHCRCVVAAAFTGSFLVMPRLINPADIGLFLNVFDNPIAVSLVIGIWMTYAASIIWGKIKDRGDEEQCHATLLQDNKEEHAYLYLLCVSTGWSMRAATSARVFLYIKGTWGTSQTHHLYDGSKRLFRSGAQNWFLLATEDDLGDILSVVVWTDFSGGHPSWFLNSVFVENLQTRETWMCLYNSWLSITFGGNQLLADITAIKEEETTTVTLHLINKGTVDMRNDHLWFGMFAKTAHNKFTRVRRLTTALTMLQTLMLLNLMFFGLRDKDDPGQFVTIFGQTIHLTSLIISIQTSVIITVMGIGLSFLFNRISPPPMIDASEFLTEEEQDMMKRRLDMQRRRRKGLDKLYLQRSDGGKSPSNVITTPSDSDVHDIQIRISTKENGVKSRTSDKSDVTSSVDSVPHTSEDITIIVTSENKTSSDDNEKPMKTTNRYTANSDYEGTDTGNVDQITHTSRPKAAQLERRDTNINASLAPADDKSVASTAKTAHTKEVKIRDSRHYSGGETQIIQRFQTSLRQSLGLVKTPAENVKDKYGRSSAVDDIRYSKKMSRASQGLRDEKKATEDEVSEITSKREAQKRKKFMLPWWTIYITWAVLSIYNLCVAYYVMLYGLDLGYEKSFEWFLAFFSGFLVNVFFLMPTKVVLMTMMLVLIFKQKYTMKEQSPLNKLTEGLKMIEKEKARRDLGITRGRNVPPVAPLNVADAKHVLERLRVESEAREMLRDLFLYTFFMIVMVIIITQHLNVTQMYHQKIHVERELLGLPGKTLFDNQEGSGKNPLEEMKTIDELWDYLTDVITPNMVPPDDTFDDDISRSYYLMTHVRLRQVRVSDVSGECEEAIPRILWPHTHGSNPCLQQLDGDTPEETRHFNETWKGPLQTEDGAPTSSPYRYWSAEELKTAVYAGQYGMYSGGGYVFTFLREDPQAVQNSLKKLRKMNWINRDSRCVFLEFTVYNSNVDMFTQVVVSFEFDRFGTIFPYKTIKTAKLDHKKRETSTWVRSAENIAALCIIFYLYTSLKSCLNLGCKTFFKNVWNWIELLVCFMSILTSILFLIRRAKFLDLMYNFQIYGHGFFLDFTSVFFWHSCFDYSMGFLGALVIFKMLKVTAFNPFMKMFSKSAVIGVFDYSAFATITTIILLAFACLGYFLFSGGAKGYTSLHSSLMTLLFFILGEPDFYVIMNVNRVLGRLFFFLFLWTSQYFILNFFIAILRESFEIAKHMPYKREKEIVRYMVQTFKLYFNMTPRNMQRKGVEVPEGWR